jgi:hypothetical protein
LSTVNIPRLRSFLTATATIDAKQPESWTIPHNTRQQWNKADKAPERLWADEDKAEKAKSEYNSKCAVN